MYIVYAFGYAFKAVNKEKVLLVTYKITH